MIKLRNLLNEETFTATNKKSGKTSVFKSKDSRDAAIKAGTHNPIKDKGDSNSKDSETPKVNIFDKPSNKPKSKPKKSNKSISQSDIDDNLGDSVEFDDYLDNNEDIFSKDDFNELKSLNSNWQQLEADSVEAEMDDDYELMDEIDTDINNIVGDITNVLDKYLDKSKKTPISKPKNKRGEGDPKVNALANKLAEKAGFTLKKLGKEKFREVMLQSAVKALKFKYRREARELVAALEGKPEFAKRVDYPYGLDPKYDEKMDYIKNNTADGSIYMNPSDDVDSYSFNVLQSSKYFAPDAVDAIANTLRINGFDADADLVQSVLNPNNKEKKNENKIQSTKLKSITESMKLRNLLNEETFTATNKKSGKTSVFKSKDSRDAAIKAGTHSEKEDNKSDKSTGTASKVNIFDKPTTSEPKSNTPKLSPKMIKMDLDDMKGTLSMSVAYAIKRGDRNPNVAFGLGDNQYDNILKRLAKIGGASEHDMKFRTDNYSTAELEKWAKERLDLVLTDEPKDEPSEPKSRKGVPAVNKAVRQQAQKLGITPEKLGKEEYLKKMAQAAVSALTDSNFHPEARQLVADLEGKPEMAEKPEYPSMKDPKYKEKMTVLNAKYDSVYNTPDKDADELGTSASQSAEWSGDTAIDAIAFDLRMNGFHKMADKIQSVIKEGKVSRTSLTRIMNESASKEAVGISVFTGTRADAIDAFIQKHELDAMKLYKSIKSANLKGRMDFVTALVGKEGNKYQQAIIKAFRK
jgi:hypothetical protein